MDRIVRSGTAGSIAVELLALADRDLSRGDLGSGRPRGDARRLARRHSNESGSARLERRTGGGERDFLSCGRGDRRTALWIWNRPARTKETILHHGRGLSRGHSTERV